jgi:hypothetical protein
MWRFGSCDVTKRHTIYLLYINRRVLMRSISLVTIVEHVGNLKKGKSWKSLKKSDVFVTHVTFLSRSWAQKLFSSASLQYEDFGTRTNSVGGPGVELERPHTHTHTDTQTHRHTDTRTPKFLLLYRVQGPQKRKEKS